MTRSGPPFEQRVLILDEIEVKPGMTTSVRKAYRSRYIPAAQARGMVLEGEWQHPPAIAIAELPATLFWLWSVEGQTGWWKQRFGRRPDGSDSRDEKQAFWQSLEPMTLSRKRRVLTDQPEKD